MKIFKSLNCIVCKTPFAPTENHARSPINLKCGKAMCGKCFNREKSTKKEKRKHRCKHDDLCFPDLKFAHFLIEVLSQDSLKLSPMGDGYLLCKPFNMPKCPICHDEYSSAQERKSPFRLFCGHFICANCCSTQKINVGRNKNNWRPIKCPICSTLTSIWTNLWRSQAVTYSLQLVEFLAELPEMMLQLEEMSEKRAVCDQLEESRRSTEKNEELKEKYLVCGFEEMGSTTYHFCKECHLEPPIDHMFYCEECEKNICASCGFQKHRSHKTRAILELDATRISEQLQKESVSQIDTYLELHNELAADIGTFATKLLSKEESLKLASKYEDFQKKHEKCIQLNTKFEAISKKCITQLQEYDAQIKDLIRSLDDDTN